MHLSDGSIQLSKDSWTGFRVRYSATEELAGEKLHNLDTIVLEDPETGAITPELRIIRLSAPKMCLSGENDTIPPLAPVAFQLASTDKSYWCREPESTAVQFEPLQLDECPQKKVKMMDPQGVWYLSPIGMNKILACL